MMALVPIALFGWIPLILLIFTLLPARRAVVVAFVAGWCFLPMYGYPIPGLPDYTKSTATCLGILLATLAFDGQRLVKFRPRLIDIPMVLWCVSPLIANTLGGFGAYEGLSSTVRQIFAWGIPYFIGRLYFTDLASMRELAVGMFCAGLVYLPLCLIEMRLSPQLHNWVYGFHQNTGDWSMVKREGGWRPTVFMAHGLAVGMFMCTTALIGVWLWRSKSIRAISGVPVAIPALALLATAILCRSTGAAALMIMGIATLWVTAKLKTRLAVRVLLLIPLLYIGMRTVGGWEGEQIVDVAREYSAERAASLEFRMRSEARAWRLAQPNIVFGFGRFVFAGREWQGQEAGVTPDGMWLIAMVANGLLGLVAVFSAMLMPVAAFIRRVRPVHWSHPAVAPTAALAVAVALHMVDNLFNAMTDPLFMLAAGGLVSTVRSIPRVPAAGAARPVPMGASMVQPRLAQS